MRNMLRNARSLTSRLPFMVAAAFSCLACVQAEQGGYRNRVVCPRIADTKSGAKVANISSFEENISGLAVSPTQVSDIGNPIIFAVADKGSTKGPRVGIYDSGTGERLLLLKIKDEKNNDWEDMAMGPCASSDETTCIYIGDFGANESRKSGGKRDGRDNIPYRIIKIREPVWKEFKDGDEISSLDYIEFDFKHESSPTSYADNEAMFVDNTGWGEGGSKGDLYFMPKWYSEKSKWNRVFKIPANAWDQTDKGKIYSPAAIGDYSTRSDFMDNSWTSADISPDGTVITLGTITDTWLFLRCPGTSIESVLAQPDSESCGKWSNPSSGQGETLAFLSGGKQILQLLEGKGEPMGYSTLQYDADNSKQVCPPPESEAPSAAQSTAPSVSVQSTSSPTKSTPNPTMKAPTTMMGEPDPAAESKKNLPFEDTSAASAVSPRSVFQDSADTRDPLFLEDSGSTFRSVSLWFLSLLCLFLL